MREARCVLRSKVGQFRRVNPAETLTLHQTSAMSARPGPKPKGGERFTVRAPTPHVELYRARAKQAGMSFSDYVALQLAAAHGLQPPPEDTAPQQELQLGA